MTSEVELILEGDVILEGDPALPGDGERAEPVGTLGVYILVGLWEVRLTTPTGDRARTGDAVRTTDEAVIFTGVVFVGDATLVLTMRRTGTVKLLPLTVTFLTRPKRACSVSKCNCTSTLPKDFFCSRRS
mmetsp:Transcript_112514/g.216740  ORF Transcript_112514/g.216740 Transcript_112514/m.216740 type:complete len:130 (-) Transcript_112514:334-723(-)